MNNGGAILAQLEAVINDRKLKPTPHSYTARLLNGGVDAIGAKICEEAAELVQAARHLQKEQGSRRDGAADETPEHVVHEAADLVYHLLVMLSHCSVTLAEVEAELARRFGTSGLDEKASRTEH